ncbi:class C sortase [Vagococcus fessus]|uniref:Class C sortase n=1 Tax=Vagococcus fessus TaxID=120370 RepID=A0A430A934_9ENTE|nr:class C sortase [Vagococcus fessus]RSU03597.1 hypothetical protein CBF31_07760 [Vagococcus fessus]
MTKKVIIALIFLSGLVLLLFPHGVRTYYTYENNKMFKEFKAETSELFKPESKSKLEEVKRKMETYDIELKKAGMEITDPFEENKENLKSLKEILNLDEGEAFGMVEIPKLNLVVPLYLSVSDEALYEGVGHVGGSSLPIGGKSTHTVIAGHRGSWTQEIFQHVDKLENGDLFYIHTRAKLLTYRVIGKVIIHPSNTEMLEIQTGKDLATLITCHPYGSNAQRLLIQGERVQD